MKTIPCTVCPLGCEIQVQEGGFQGARCPRGEAYAEQELEDPRRTLTTTVEIQGAVLPLLPVRTDRPIPLGLVFGAMEVLAKIRVNAPVHIGDVILEDLLGTGAKVIATRTME